MSPVDVTTTYTCDCGCGAVIEPHEPRFVVNGWEIIESKRHAAGGTAVFVSPSHVAALAKQLAKQYGDPLEPVDREPDEYLVAHFAVQEMTDAELAAAWADHDAANAPADAPWSRAVREEYDRRLLPTPEAA